MLKVKSANKFAKTLRRAICLPFDLLKTARGHAITSADVAGETQILLPHTVIVLSENCI
jgi:hypothetical protein